MDTDIGHIDALLQKRGLFQYTSEDTVELKDTLASLLPLCEYDIKKIKGSTVIDVIIVTRHLTHAVIFT